MPIPPQDLVAPLLEPACSAPTESRPDIQQRRLIMILEAAHVGVWDWDLRTNQVAFSDIWKQQLGYAEHEIRDHYEEWASRVHPDDLPGMLAKVREAITSPRGNYCAEFRMRAKDNNWRWIQSRGFVLVENGQPARMLGVHLDVTHRRNAEEALQASENRFRERLEQTRAAAELSQRHFAFVSQAGALLASSLNYRETLPKVLQLAVPLLAQWCTIDLRQRDGRFSHVGPVHAKTNQVGWTNNFEYSVNDPGEHPVHMVLKSGRMMQFRGVAESYWLAEPRRDQSESKLCSCVVVPMVSNNDLLGVLTFANTNTLPNREKELISVVTNLARHIAAAVTNAELYRVAQKRSRDLERIGSLLSQAEEKERCRLAVDIHDSIGQNLSALKRLLELARENDREKHLLEATSIVKDVIQQTRDLSFELHPAMLEDLGLGPTLHWFTERFQARYKIRVDFAEQGPPKALPGTLASYLYRATCELMHNVAKHAKAAQVVVLVVWSEASLRILVTDDGCGFKVEERIDTRHTLGLGLISVRERMIAMGGRFAIESEPGHGTRAHLFVSLVDSALELEIGQLEAETQQQSD